MKPLLLSSLILLLTLTPPARASDPLRYKVALLSNPVTQIPWTPDTVASLKSAGFNTIQLNIAWGSRPFNEPLNLRDVVSPPGETIPPDVAARNKELHRRLALAKSAGLRTLFHFGSPYMWRDPDTGTLKPASGDAFHKPFFDTGNPKLVAYETSLLAELAKEFPDLDDILVYTYDQDAWQASQFSEAQYSRGIPLHHRLPTYLKQLQSAFIQGRTGHRMWWEPWELSAGQVYKVLPQLPANNFGLIIHCNIAEAEIARPADLWYRQLARLASECNLPVIGEAAFCDMTEETQDFSIPCPRLVDEQFLAMTSTPGIVGIKEYFGTLPTHTDLNFSTFSARLTGSTVPTNDLLVGLTSRFGDHQPEVLKLLKHTTDAMQMYPWEAAWQFRLTSHASTDHGWSAAYIHGQMADTPSWNSTRRGMFMVTDDQQQHPDLLEDVGLRCGLAADDLQQAIPLAQQLSTDLPDPADQAYFARLAKDADGFMRVARSFSLHLRETNVAWLLRGDLDHHRPLTPTLVAEMKDLLARDAENQHNQGRVVDMQKLFTDNPEEFLKSKLLPSKTVLEKGHFTVTTR
jgi:hypothetical protein